MNYDELVNALRKRAHDLPERFSKNELNIKLFLEAADAIEELIGSVDRYRALAAREQQINIERAAKAPKWIRVKDELPKENVEAIALAKNGNIFRCDCLRDYILRYGNYGEVTHWMPLPEPPKEE